MRGGDTGSFKITSPTTVSLKRGWWAGHIKLSTVDLRHKGSGTARGLPSGESFGMLNCKTWTQLETAERVTVTITSTTLELQFGAGPDNDIVGSYFGSWTKHAPPPPPPPPPPPAPQVESEDGDGDGDRDGDRAFYSVGWFRFAD